MREFHLVPHLAQKLSLLAQNARLIIETLRSVEYVAYSRTNSALWKGSQSLAWELLRSLVQVRLKCEVFVLLVLRGIILFNSSLSVQSQLAKPFMKSPNVLKRPEIGIIHGVQAHNVVRCFRVVWISLKHLRELEIKDGSNCEEEGLKSYPINLSTLVEAFPEVWKLLLLHRGCYSSTVQGHIFRTARFDEAQQVHNSNKGL